VFTAIEFPATLPVPDPGTVKVTERRLVSTIPGFQQVRQIQGDYLATQEVSWLLIPDEAEIMYDWWMNTITEGGLWFASDWPLPKGWAVAVRRFTGPLKWDHVPGGNWRVSGLTEVRGIGELPLTNSDCATRTEFVSEVLNVPIELFYFQSYVYGTPTPDPPVGTPNIPTGMQSVPLVQAQLAGAIYGGVPSYFPGELTMSWDALHDGLDEVNVFSISRAGVAPQPPLYTGGSITSFALNITGQPIHKTGCRVLVFLALGSWETMAVFINSDTVADPGYGGQNVWIANALSGNAVQVEWNTGGGTPITMNLCVGICILKNNRGTLTANWVSADQNPPIDPTP